MNFNHSNSRTLITLLMSASIISACGNPKENTQDEEPIVDDNNTKFSICHDSNLDASCVMESTAQEFDTQIEALSAAVTQGSGPVIIHGEQGSLLMAASTAQGVTLFSTIAYNESLINPTVTNDDDIATYIETKLALTADNITQAHYDDFNASIVAAKLAYPDVQDYVVLSAVIDAAVIQGSLKNAMPTQAQLTQKTALSRKIISDLSVQSKGSWTTTDGDERVNMIKVQGDKVLVVSRWHNQVSIMDVNSIDQANEAQPFAAIMSAGHHIESTEADFVTGASEHTLSDAWLNEAGDVLYALVPGPESTVSGDDTFGLFRVPLVDGKIPAFEVNVTTEDGEISVSAPHRHDSVTRIANANLEDVISLNDGSVLAFDADAGYVRVFDGMLIQDETKAFPVDSALLGWSLINGGDTLVMVLAATDNSDGVIIETRDTTQLTTIVSSVESSLSKASILSAKQSSTFMIISDNLLIQFDGQSLNKINQIDLAKEISSSVHSISADGELVAVSINGGIQLVSFKELYPVAVGNIAYEGRLRALTLNGQAELLYSDEGGSLTTVDISTLETAAKSVDVLLSEALNGIDSDSINHDYSLDAVAYDMNLPVSNGSIDLNWSVSDSISDSIVLDGSDNQGQITRPTIGENSVTGTLDVTASYSFRGEVSSSLEDDNQSFDISIRPLTQLLDSTQFVLTGDLVDLEFEYVSTNELGNKLVGLTPGNADHGAGIAVFSYASPALTQSELFTFPQGFADAKIGGVVVYANMAQVLINMDDIKTYILTFNLDSETWTGELELEGVIKYEPMGISQDGSVISVALNRYNETDTVPLETYVINTYQSSDLSLINTIQTDQSAVGSRAPVVTPTNDGLSVMGYIRTDDKKRFLKLFSADTDSAPESSGPLSGAAYGWEYVNDLDLLVGGNFASTIFFVENATNGGDLANPSVFDPAHGEYDGVNDSGRGRFYFTSVNNNTAYIWSSDRGVMSLDITDVNAPTENFWSGINYTKSGDLSGDGQVLFTHSYDDQSGVSSIHVLDIQ
ncbi:MAG: hypothetical protein HRU38_22635 [Saccharospirillaceae bacterium]|nr:hypothetical protein [Pseudomonadales bacterium]NRB81424.1 hypothetical protein [Saccharospirillaceae bacterium]